MNLQAVRVHQHSPGFHMGARFEGDRLRRFAAVAPHADRVAAAVRADHPALKTGRTIFPSTVRTADDAGRIFVGGHNNPKLGARVQVGPWRGMPIYHLTLEERATCPRSCHEWATCYGNTMHLAKRWRVSRDLLTFMGDELLWLRGKHPHGFVIRLHTLGDFPSPRYVGWWSMALRLLPELHVFGYSAWPDGHPIQRMLERMNALFPQQSFIRFSRQKPSGQGFEATTIWRQAGAAKRVPEGMICPAQNGRTSCCATCGFCWHPALTQVPIVFMGHGRRSRGSGP